MGEVQEKEQAARTASVRLPMCGVASNKLSLQYVLLPFARGTRLARPPWLVLMTLRTIG